MTIAPMKMQVLYERLSQIGFNKKFIQDKILPDWWESSCENTPGAVAEVAAYISRRLNLELDSLLDKNSQPRFKNICQPKFKKQNNTNSNELTVAYYLASRIAELTAYACPTEYQAIDRLSLTEIRNFIFQKRKYVDLAGVLIFCWSRGIPVIYFTEFPKKVKKFNGMVASVANRPVIIISLKEKSPSRLLFVIAHELGHIYKEHINNKVLIDEKVEPDSIDNEEIQANEFAKELIFGNSDVDYSTSHNLDTKRLVTYCKNVSNRDLVDPGAVAWNYGWHKEHWGAVREAIKIIEDKDTDNYYKINNYLQNNLNWSKLNDDNQDYLALMTGLEIENIIGV